MTPRIPALDETRAPAASAPILAQVRKTLGMVPNLHLTLAHSPAALTAYTGMAGALAGGTLEPRLRERLALTTAARNGCDYCASAHTAIGGSLGLDADELRDALSARSSDAAAAAALAFARTVIERRGEVTDADLATVREAGFDDAQVLEIVAHVALNTLTNFVNNVARTEIDFPKVELAGAAA